MRIEIMGSGGAITIPRPGCECHVCAEARRKGVPYSRKGPSIFIHDLSLLIDTPEEIKDMLNRAQIKRVEAALYSHWHPDHVMGLRVWETMNADWLKWPPQHRHTDIYLPQQVAQDFRVRLGAWDQLMYLQRFGVVNVIELRDGDVITLGDTQIRPFRLAQDYVYAFLFEQGSKRFLIAPDELFDWTPPESLCGLDLVILPMGLPEFHPFTGQRLIPADHPVLKSEATFAQTLDMVRRLRAKRVIMTHIEEIGTLTYGDCLRLERQLQAQGYPITFAHDMMRVEV